MAPSSTARARSSIFLKSPLGSARMSESSWIGVCDRVHWTADGTSPTSAVACLPGSSQIFAKGLSRQPGPKVVTVSTHRQLGRKFSCAEKSLPNLAQGAGHKSGGVHSPKRLFPRIGLCLNKPQETLCARGSVTGFLARGTKVAQHPCYLPVAPLYLLVPALLLSFVLRPSTLVGHCVISLSRLW